MSGQIRIAFRNEGYVVNAYVAMFGTMDKALLVSSMAVGLLEAHPPAFDAWKGVVQQAVAALMASSGAGQVIGFREEPAPEHEKAGHA